MPGIRRRSASENMRIGVIISDEPRINDEIRVSQVRLIGPKLIVCLGRIAACKLIRPDFKITTERGTYTEKAGILMTATFHPAAVLRDPRKKADMFSDFIEIKHRYDQFVNV